MSHIEGGRRQGGDTEKSWFFIFVWNWSQCRIWGHRLITEIPLALFKVSVAYRTEDTHSLEERKVCGVFHTIFVHILWKLLTTPN